jgi:hypothetical protein
MVELLTAPFAKLLLFALIVFTGTFAFLRLASRAYSKPEGALPTSVLVSAAALRLALGVVVAVAANAILLRFPELPRRTVVLLLGFLPFRLGLWHLILRMFFDRERPSEDRRARGRAALTLRWTVFGATVSYLLDTPALIIGTAVLGSIA